MVTAGSMPRQECTVELLNACVPTPPRSTPTCLGMSSINDRPIRVVGIAQLYSEDSPRASQVLPQQGPGSVELRQTASRWSVRWRAADTRQRHSITKLPGTICTSHRAPLDRAEADVPACWMGVGMGNW